MKAMIFAAGLGTRLGKITENIPKALLQLNGKTVLHHAVEKCRDHGFDDVIINVHYFADKVIGEVEMLKKSGYRIEVSDESGRLLETGGGLYKARDFFDSNPFLLFNVDIITSFDLGALYHYHLMKKGLATLAVRHRPGTRYFLTDREGKIRGWRNKVTGEQILAVADTSELSEIAFSGIHVVRGSGQVGAGSRILIRGVNSLELPGDPLVFVDGIRVNTRVASGQSEAPFVVGILDLIPADAVSRIEVLKGPSATRFGVGSSNGVILVFTR